MTEYDERELRAQELWLECGPRAVQAPLRFERTLDLHGKGPIVNIWADVENVGFEESMRVRVLKIVSREDFMDDEKLKIQLQLMYTALRSELLNPPRGVRWNTKEKRFQA